MKTYILPLAIIMLCTLFACSDDDDSNLKLNLTPPIELTDKTQTDSKIKELNGLYGCYFKYQFQPEEFTYNWTEHISTIKYTPAKPEAVSDLLDFYQKEVLSILPKELIEEYIPTVILLVDTLSGTFSDWDGDITENYMVLGRAGSQFSTLDHELLKENWLSLLIEKMLDRWEYPKEFASISEDGYHPMKRFGDMQFPMASIPASTNMVKKYAILKFSRKGAYDMFKRNMNLTTYAQDFGDFVAFIIFKTPSEKATYYGNNPKIEEKVNLVKEYFKKHFNLVLPEAQE